MIYCTAGRRGALLAAIFATALFSGVAGARPGTAVADGPSVA